MSDTYPQRLFRRKFENLIRERGVFLDFLHLVESADAGRLIHHHLHEQAVRFPVCQDNLGVTASGSIVICQCHYIAVS